MRLSCPSCNWVYYPDPKVAATALVTQDNGILLVKRLNDPQRGLWTLPGGFVDAGEDPAQSAERECLEETGLQVQVTRLLDVLAGQEHPRGAHILIVYLAEVIGGTLQPQDDAEDARFFPSLHLPPLAFRSTEQIIQRFVQTFSFDK
ncbi:MAG: NUDIX hydrolase [Anaerolineales bacterium]|nr:NUDIX hydrolase [Anaerolineales bacterium]